jgi:hypothetical protein
MRSGAKKYWLLVILFSLELFLDDSPVDVFYLEDAIRDALIRQPIPFSMSTQRKTFRDVASIADVWAYLHGVLLPGALATSEWGNPSNVLGGIKLRTTLERPTACNEAPPGLTFSPCYAQQGGPVEDRRPFGPNGRFWWSDSCATGNRSRAKGLDCVSYPGEWLSLVADYGLRGCAATSSRARARAMVLAWMVRACRTCLELCARVGRRARATWPGVGLGSGTCRYAYVLPSTHSAAQAELASLRRDGWLNDTNTRSCATHTRARGESRTRLHTDTNASAHIVTFGRFAQARMLLW